MELLESNRDKNEVFTRKFNDGDGAVRSHPPTPLERFVANNARKSVFALADDAGISHVQHLVLEFHLCFRRWLDSR